MSDSVEVAIQRAAAGATATGPATPIVIKEDRSIVVPTAMQQIAVQCDNEANVLHFVCPRNWADIDLAAAVLYINVVKPDKSIVAFTCTNVVSSEDTVTFDWVVTEPVTDVVGKLSFLVCARDPSDPGDGYRWHSNLCDSLFIAPGIVCTVPSDTPDPPHIPLYGTDTTLTEPGVPADAAAVGKALSSLDGVGIGITGATVGQIAKITSVDDTGKPTAWQAVDMPISFKPVGKSYLTFSSSSSFTLAVNDSTKHWNGTLEYFAADKTWTTWTTWDGTTTLSSVDNDGEHVLYLRGTGNTKIGYYDYVDTEDYIPWVINGTDVRCSGNIETLLDYAMVEAGQHPTMATECFIGLFKDCIALSQAPDLPATTLADNCYDSMFRDCTSLAQAPSLPATTLADNCYVSMFQGCTALTQAPALPAATLSYACYQYMFYGCASITQAPALPAIALANNCYSSMFQGCTALTHVPALPATTLKNWCYQRMFQGCISLKLSSTQTVEYTQEYRIPSSGKGVTATDALADMFTSTGGTFTGTPTINTTYYLSSDNMIVRETEIDTLNEYVGSMIDVAIAEQTSNPLNIIGATVGQIAKITAVDGTGKPTKWEAADMPSGGGGASYRSWSKVWTLAVAEDIAGFEASNIDLDGKSEIMIVFISDSTASRTMVNGRLIINGVDAGKVLFNSLPLRKDSHSFVIIGRADDGIEYTTMAAKAEYQTYPWQGDVNVVPRLVSGTNTVISWIAGSTIEITQASATLGQGITIEIYVR